MKFFLYKNLPDLQSRKNIVALDLSNWDDWFTYSTLYNVYFYDENSQIHHLGSTKIGQTEMLSSQRTPEIPKNFEKLTDNFFSLGQDVSFYEKLNDFGEDIRESILDSLNDIAYDSKMYEVAINERVTKNSLLRDVSVTSVLGEFKRLAKGIIELTPYNFQFFSKYNSKSKSQRMILDFNVLPKSNPPSNIHVIIGRNGVGKTHLFNSMISSLIHENNNRGSNGYFLNCDNPDKNIFSNLVFVSFSAFDDTTIIEEKKDKLNNIKYTYIGLKKLLKEGRTLPKSPLVLKNEFVKSVEKCRLGSKNERWLEALKTLETDPIFKEAEVSKIAKFDLNEDVRDLASNTFKKLSSGHKIILLTITRLVESIEEKSLVLLDEPEGYLHPPLLSAFIRALSDLLIKRNAVAIIGTHSPVVLQEVPKNCVWKLRRHGVTVIAERLEIESFGENVGILTQEVFGLEVTDSGFHKILKENVTNSKNFEEGIGKFNYQIGNEAKAILRSLFILKKDEKNQ